MSKTPKAVILDIGGVVVGSPLVGINEYEKTHGLPFDYLNVAITAAGREGAFQRLERSEVDMYTFYRDFGNELSQVDTLNAHFRRFCKARGQPVPALPTSLKVDGRELFGVMMKQSTVIDENMAKAIGRLRASGRFQLAALTNNFSPPTSAGDKAPSLEEELKHLGLEGGGKRVRGMFDFFVESAVVGMRKPEEGFYRHALDLLKVKPEEVVFLDDIGINLKAAQALGIRTIRVSPRSSLPALRELEKVVGIKLIDDKDAEAEERRLQAKERGESRL